MHVRELFENAVPRPLVVRPALRDEKIEAAKRTTPRWFIRGGADESIVVASLKAFDEQDEADARLLVHAYNHFPDLLKAAAEMVDGYAGARTRLKAAVMAARKVKV